MKPKDTIQAIGAMSIVKANESQAVTYGVAHETFPINDLGATVKIDRSFLSGQSTFRLKHISTCLALAGKDDNQPNRQWFNKEVRDPYHKALRFLNRTFMANATPVTIGLSKRASKRKSDEGAITFTAKFGYEKTVKPKSIADKVEDKAKEKTPRKSKGLANIGAVAKVTQTLTPKPEVEPAERETVTPAVETVA